MATNAEQGAPYTAGAPRRVLPELRPPLCTRLECRGRRHNGATSVGVPQRQRICLNRRNKGGLRRVKGLANEPMGERSPCARGTTIKDELHRTAAVLAHAEAVAERLLRPVDELDYRVRRWLRPVSWGSPLRKQASIRDLVSHVQDAIGRSLREEYVLEQSMPDRLANLLREFEQQTVPVNYRGS
jgi:hypothetical protein